MSNLKTTASSYSCYFKIDELNPVIQDVNRLYHVCFTSVILASNIFLRNEFYTELCLTSIYLTPNMDLCTSCVHGKKSAAALKQKLMSKHSSGQITLLIKKITGNLTCSITVAVYCT